MWAEDHEQQNQSVDMEKIITYTILFNPECCMSCLGVVACSIVWFTRDRWIPFMDIFILCCLAITFWHQIRISEEDESVQGYHIRYLVFGRAYSAA